jgi:hypothetical protein
VESIPWSRRAPEEPDIDFWRDQFLIDAVSLLHRRNRADRDYPARLTLDFGIIKSTRDSAGALISHGLDVDPTDGLDALTDALDGASLDRFEADNGRLPWPMRPYDDEPLNKQGMLSLVSTSPREMIRNALSVSRKMVLEPGLVGSTAKSSIRYRSVSVHAQVNVEQRTIEYRVHNARSPDAAPISNDRSRTLRRIRDLSKGSVELDPVHEHKDDEGWPWVQYGGRVRCTPHA